ncbi:hypothetical protein PIB30_064801 [Stylosanthes scabra]|uniref:Uncharacterized protein n=1 Tax=Stylosanthes scabra TaxID=79078 RepID=A0ABU6ZKL5_9FABA|nr:hypothetical protein [Stylosanthes scabra]
MAEVFKQTHTLKENKEKFADKRSSDIWDEYIDNTANATQQAAEYGTSTPVDPDEVWRRTVSEPDVVCNYSPPEIIPTTISIGRHSSCCVLNINRMIEGEGRELVFKLKGYEHKGGRKSINYGCLSSLACCCH